MKDVVIKQSDYAEETTDPNEPRLAKRYGPLCPCGCGVRVARSGIREIEVCERNGARFVLIGFGGLDREHIKVLPGDEDELRNFLTRPCYTYAWQKHRVTAMPKILALAQECGGMKQLILKVQRFQKAKGLRRLDSLLFIAQNGFPQDVEQNTQEGNRFARTSPSENSVHHHDETTITANDG